MKKDFLLSHISINQFWRGLEPQTQRHKDINTRQTFCLFVFRSWRMGCRANGNQTGGGSGLYSSTNLDRRLRRVFTQNSYRGGVYVKD